MIEVSIVLCCYNSSDRLRDTLSHLVRQNAPDDIWEVIVVDNASTDDTAQVAVEFWGTDRPVPLRVVRESRPGVANARRRGFMEAAGPLVCFVDDDNWLDESWVRITLELMTAHPTVGALGSRGEAVSSREMPDWFDAIKRGYAVGPQAPIDGDVTDTVRCFWGAGLTIRKEAWEQLESCGFGTILGGHTANEVIGGADSELVIAVGLAGWRLWYDHRLTFKHFLSDGKLTWDYARKLYRGFGAAGWVPPLYRKTDADRESRGYRARMWAGWLYLVLHSSIRIVRLFLRSPWTMIRGMEGSLLVLALDREYGRLASLIAARNNFVRVRARVATFVDCVSATAVDVKRNLS